METYIVLHLYAYKFSKGQTFTADQVPKEILAHLLEVKAIEKVEPK